MFVVSSFFVSKKLLFFCCKVVVLTCLRFCAERDARERERERCDIKMMHIVGKLCCVFVVSSFFF